MRLHHLSSLISLADASTNERDLQEWSYHEIFLGAGRATISHERWFCLLGAGLNGCIGSRLDGVGAYHMFCFMNCY